MVRHEPAYLAEVGRVALEAAALEHELILGITYIVGGSDRKVARLLRDWGSSKLLDLLGEWWKDDRELKEHRRIARELLQKRNDYVHAVAAWTTGPAGEASQVLYAAREIWGKPIPKPGVSDLRHLAIDLSNEKMWFNHFLSMKYKG